MEGNVRVCKEGTVEKGTTLTMIITRVKSQLTSTLGVDVARGRGIGASPEMSDHLESGRSGMSPLWTVDAGSGDVTLLSLTLKKSKTYLIKVL